MSDERRTGEAVHKRIHHAMHRIHANHEHSRKVAADLQAEREAEQAKQAKESKP